MPGTYTSTTGTIYSSWANEWSTTTATTTWSAWFGDSETTTGTWYTADDRSELRAERSAQMQEQARLDAEARKQANEKAQMLLLSCLTKQQKAQFNKRGFFEVKGQETKRRYRINMGMIGNVHLLDGRGRKQQAYCAHPVGSIPVADVMLAQKLMLENHERDFLNTANLH